MVSTSTKSPTAPKTLSPVKPFVLSEINLKASTQLQAWSLPLTLMKGVSNRFFNKPSQA